MGILKRVETRPDCERSLKCSQAGIEAGSIAIPAAQVLARGNTIDRVGRQAANGPELEREDRAHVAVPADAPGKPRPDARLTPETVLDLQRAAGNRAAGALIDRRRAALAERATVVERAACPAAAVKLARKSAAEPPAPALDRAPRRSLQRKFWSRLWSGIKHIGSAIWEGAKSAGSHIIDWVESASSAVLDAIKWFGVKSWEVIEFIGTRAWEALSRLPTLAWTFISNLPVRVWRFVIDSWDSITRVADWVWKALQGAAGASWDAFVGTFKWLEHGFAGALNWLWYGIAGGASWVYDFVRAPSWDKLRDALLGSLSWLGDGIKGLAKWGWQGVVGAARWAKDGLAALGGWMWDTVCGGFWQGLDLIVDFVSMIGAGEGLQYLWGVFNHMRPLSAEEICASQVVHPSGMIPYDKVRVDDQSLLTKINGGRAVTTMHIIHAPADFPLDVVVHELTHVAQYEKVGAKYLPEAAHAQATEGYDYIGAGHKYANIRQARTKGARFKDFNREQQAQIAEDYYLWKACSAGTPSAAASCPTPALVNPTPAQQTQQAKRTQALNTMCVKTQASPPLATEAELAPFLGDMRAGDF
jgi:hypothetical protein